MRRMAPIKSSKGTVWPAGVREHVATHQRECLGPSVGMPGPCMGSPELDHVRAGGTGMKSESIATNGARLCSWHHSIRTREGRRYRPLLIARIAQLASECTACQRESITVYGRPLDETLSEPLHATLVLPGEPLEQALARLERRSDYVEVIGSEAGQQLLDAIKRQHVDRIAS